MSGVPRDRHGGFAFRIARLSDPTGYREMVLALLSRPAGTALPYRVEGYAVRQPGGEAAASDLVKAGLAYRQRLGMGGRRVHLVVRTARPFSATDHPMLREAA
jgi:hypothetical protein